MAIVVSVLGAAIALMGLIGLVQPRRLAGLVEHWNSPARYRAAVVVRILLGVVLIRAAPTCRMPEVVRAVGIVALVAALALLVVGRARTDTLIRWWLARPGTVRPAGLLAAAFGALLVSAGV